MRKFYLIIWCCISFVTAHSQCSVSLDSMLKYATTDRAIVYNMQHKFLLLTDQTITPTLYSKSFNHSWTKDDACLVSHVEPLQPGNFNAFGFNIFDDNNFTINGSDSAFATETVTELGYTNSALLISDSCKSLAVAGSCLNIQPGLFDNGCQGIIQNYGIAQSVGDITCRSEAYSFSVAGFEITDDESMLKGRIDWEPTLFCKQKGKGHTVLQKSGTNDPVLFYIKDSITGIDTSLTLLSITFDFVAATDSIVRNNYWQNDTVHIESDSSVFSIIFPSKVTSLRDTLIITTAADTVSSIIKTGTYASFTGVAVGTPLPLTFYLNDSITFHYNLDTLGLLSSMGIGVSDSLLVKLILYANSKNCYTIDTTPIFITPVIANPTCNICNDGAITIAPSLGTAPYTYLWSNGATTASITGLVPGVYTVTVVDSSGCTLSKSYTLQAPPCIINIDIVWQYECISTPGTATANVTGGSAPYTYMWSTNAFAQTITGLSEGTYTVTVTDIGGCTASASVYIAPVNSIPIVPSTISGTAVVCKNSGLLSFTTPTIMGVTTYNWVVGPGATIVSGQGTPSIDVSFGNNAVSSSVKVSTTNACGTSAYKSKTYKVSSVPSMPGLINGPASGVCLATNVTYSVGIVSGATSYHWSVPVGVTIVSGQGTRVVTLTFTNIFAGNGTIAVTASNLCGTSTARVLNIKASPNLPIIAGPNSVCINQPGVVYNVPAVAGATSYIWTVVPGSYIVSGQGTTSIVVNWGAINGLIKCKAVNACGASATATKAVSFVCRQSVDFSPLEMIVAPNPAFDEVAITFISDSEVAIDLQIFDFAGKIVHTKAMVASQGEKQCNIDCQQWSSGNYIVKCKLNETVIHKKLVIIH